MVIMATYPFGRSIKVNFQEPTGVYDEDGVEAYSPRTQQFDFCSVYDYDANAITTNELFGQNEQAIIGKTVVLGEQVNINFIDTFEVLDEPGNVYRVYGKPMNHHSALTASELGTVILGQLVEG